MRAQRQGVASAIRWIVGAIFPAPATSALGQEGPVDVVSLEAEMRGRGNSSFSGAMNRTNLKNCRYSLYAVSGPTTAICSTELASFQVRSFRVLCVTLPQ